MWALPRRGWQRVCALWNSTQLVTAFLKDVEAVRSGGVCVYMRRSAVWDAPFMALRSMRVQAVNAVIHT